MKTDILTRPLPCIDLPKAWHHVDRISKQQFSSFTGRIVQDAVSGGSAVYLVGLDKDGNTITENIPLPNMLRQS